MNMPQLQAYDPLTGTAIDDLFRGFFAPVRLEKSGPAAIKMDVTESDGGYLVRAEVPGVKKDEIQVTIEGNQVTVAAEVKREAEKKDGERVLHTERYVGRVYRSFVLPTEIDEASSEAKYDSGVLELKLVKKAAVAGRKLSIQ
jgi:HSP20 family protein